MTGRQSPASATRLFSAVDADQKVAELGRKNGINEGAYCKGTTTGPYSLSSHAWNIRMTHNGCCQLRAPDRCSRHFSRIGWGSK